MEENLTPRSGTHRKPLVISDNFVKGLNEARLYVPPTLDDENECMTILSELESLY